MLHLNSKKKNSKSKSKCLQMLTSLRHRKEIQQSRVVFTYYNNNKKYNNYFNIPLQIQNQIH